MQHSLASLSQWYTEGAAFTEERLRELATSGANVHPFVLLWANLNRYEPAPFTREEALAQFMRGVQGHRQ
jgi:hypothetical protein